MTKKSLFSPSVPNLGSAMSAQRMRSSRSRPDLVSKSSAASLVFLIALGLAGCRDSATTQESNAPSSQTNAPIEAVDSNGSRDSKGVAITTDEVANRAKSEANWKIIADQWNAIYMLGRKVGYSHLIVQQGPGQNGVERKIVCQTRLSFSRDGTLMEMAIDQQSNETENGAPVSYSSETKASGANMRESGELKNGSLTYKIVEAGAAKANRVKLPADTRGPFGVEEELLMRRMSPGEKRSIKMIGVRPMPIIAEVQLAADSEWAPAPRGPGSAPGGERALKVTCKTPLAGGAVLESFAWISEDGRILRNEVPAAQQVSVSTTREAALSTSEEPKIDLLNDLVVKLAGKLDGFVGANRVVYRVAYDDGDAAALFRKGSTQQVTPLKDASGKVIAAEVIVSAISPMDGHSKTGTTATLPDEAEKADLPTDADLAASPLIQKDDPLIVQLATEATRDVAAVNSEESNHAATAVALEKFVHGYITRRNFSQVFSSAVETAKGKQGDCTEHAALLVALLRAKNIPARAAIGLVAIEPGDRLGYHMWTEAWLAGRWVPLDAMAGRGGTNAGYLLLATAPLSGDDSYASFFNLLKLLGKLKVEVIRVGEGSQK